MVLTTAWKRLQGCLVAVTFTILSLLSPATSAHLFIINPGPDQTQVTPPTADFDIPVGQKELIVRVQSGGPDETMCTTKVTANVLSGNALERVGPETQEYYHPTETYRDVKFNMAVTGTATARISWEILPPGNPPNCFGGATIDLSVSLSQVAPQRGEVTVVAGDDSFSVGDPVSLATGELHSNMNLMPDHDLGGPLRLFFARYYGSSLDTTGGIGRNWMHNFDSTGVILTGLSSQRAEIKLFGGRYIEFVRNGGNWDLTSTEKLAHQLQDDGAGGLLYLNPADNLVYAYDEFGRLTGITDRSGNSLTITQGDDGPTMVTDNFGRSLTFTYNGGLLTRVTDNNGINTQYGHSNGNLISYRDRGGETTTYGNTSAGGIPGLLATTTLPSGDVPLSQTYDSEARVATQTTGTGNVTTYTYDQGGGTTSAVTEPGGSSLSAVHPTDDGVSGITTWSGATESFTYDAQGRILTHTNAAGDTRTFTYHQASGQINGFTDFGDQNWLVAYAEQTQAGFSYWLPTTITYPDGATDTYTYDAAGRMTQTVDRDGNTTTLTYNANGQVLSHTNPAGGTTAITYDGSGNIQTDTSPAGIVLNSTHDTGSRLTSLILDGNPIRTFAYSNADYITSVADALERTTTFSYDADGILTSISDSQGEQQVAAHNEDGRLVGFTDRTGNQTMFTYGAADNLSSVTNAAGEMRSMSYDAANRLAEVADAVGSVAQYSYDNLNRIVSTTLADGRTDAFVYDADSRLTQHTSPNGLVSNLTYDSLGRVTRIDIDSETALTLGYTGSQVTSSTSGGLTASYAYNSLGQPVMITDPNGQEWDSSYDTAGRLTQRSDPLNQNITFSYDSLGRMTTVGTPEGDTTRSFDAANNMTGISFYDGLVHSYAYDHNNLLLSTSDVVFQRDAEGRMTHSNGIEISYDPAGRIADITYATNKAVTYTYDARGRLTQMSDWVGGTTTYTYDSTDRLLQITRPNGTTTTYTYDDDNHMTSVSHNADTTLASTTLQRNAIGQIVSTEPFGPVYLSLVADAQARSYDNASQLTGASYDGLGRLVSDGANVFTWDGNSNLLSFNDGVGTTTYTYDGLGYRISRNDGGTTTTYTLNYVFGPPVVATSNSTGDQWHYVYDSNGRLQYRINNADNSRQYYHFDHQDSTQLITDDASTVVQAYANTPFGDRTTALTGLQQPFIYHGALGVMAENEAGLYYMRRRYYDAQHTRFLSRDPINGVDPLGINPYQFAYNQPLAYRDPLGLWPELANPTGARTQPSALDRIATRDRDRLPPWGDLTGVREVVPIYAQTAADRGRLGFGDAFGGSSLRFGDAFRRRAFERRQAQAKQRSRFSRQNQIDFNISNAYDIFGSTGDNPLRDGSYQTCNASSPDEGCSTGGLSLEERFVPSVTFPGSCNSSGTFYFFDQNNWEVMVKVLDGTTPAFGSFWVFAAATTNVPYDLTVTDTTTGEVRNYENVGFGDRFQPITDTSAFATCP